VGKLPTFVTLAQSFARISRVHTLWSTRDVPLDSVEIRCTSTRAQASFSGLPCFSFFGLCSQYYT